MLRCPFRGVISIFRKECNTIIALTEKIGIPVKPFERVCRGLRKAKIVDIDAGGVISVDSSRICVRFELRMESNVSESPWPINDPITESQIVM
jgi:hypothetical protein